MINPEVGEHLALHDNPAEMMSLGRLDWSESTGVVEEVEYIFHLQRSDRIELGTTTGRYEQEGAPGHGPHLNYELE
jgi:hypothetical protein